MKHPLDDLDADIRDHLERETQENIERGMTPEEARYAALRKFGNITLAKEDTRAVWVPIWLQDLLQDLRYGLRQLRRNPGFTAAAVLTLALGIGANTAIFSLLDAVMLRALPVEEPNRLVEITELYPGESLHIAPFSWSDYEHMRNASSVFSDLIGVSFHPFELGDSSGDAHTVQGAYVSGNYFSTLGLRPAVGRLIGPRDERMGTSESAVVVLSWAYWNARFDRDPAVVGTAITVNAIPATIVGVAPPAFSGLEPGVQRDAWVPIGMEPLIDHPSRLSSGIRGASTPSAG